MSTLRLVCQFCGEPVELTPVVEKRFQESKELCHTDCLMKNVDTTIRALTASVSKNVILADGDWIEIDHPRWGVCEALVIGVDEDKNGKEFYYIELTDGTATWCGKSDVVKKLPPKS